MRVLIILCLVAVAIAQEFYNSKYDNFDIDEMVNNDRLLMSYANCFLGTGKCTAEGKDFKSWIPDGAKSACAKCSEKQKKIVAKAMNAMSSKLPKEYGELMNLHDPKNEFAAARKEFLDKYL